MLQTSTSTSTSKKESKSTSIQANMEDELKDMMSLNSKDFTEPFLFSDATLIAGGKTLHCHRVILSLNSPVFKLLFESSFKEADTKTVTLPEEHGDILVLLRYLYEPNPKDFSADQARKLLPIVHKYQIKDLIDQMERTIMYNTPDFNAVELINTGDKFGLEKMKQTGIETIAKFPLDRSTEILKDNQVSFEIRNKIMERRVQILEKSITDIQKSFSSSCLKVESKVAKVPSNHCGEHGGPLTCISFVSQNIQNGNASEQQNQEPNQRENQENRPPPGHQSSVSASIRPFNTNSNQIEMVPPQQRPNQQALGTPAQPPQQHPPQEGGVCSNCVDNLKSHITDICMRAMHKVPIVLFKN